MTFCTACTWACAMIQGSIESLNFHLVLFLFVAASAIADHDSILGSFGITINFILQDVHVYVYIQLSIV